MKLHSGICVLEEQSKARGIGSKQLKLYGRKLRTSKEKIWFDDKVEAMLKEFSGNYSGCKVDIDDIMNYLRKLNFARSIYHYAPIVKGIEKFKEDNHEYRAHKKFVKKAFARILKEFKKEQFTVLEYNSIDDLLEYLPKDDSHPGWSGLILGIYTKKELIEKEGFGRWLEELNKALEVGSFNKPILVGYRTQAGSPFTKDGDYAWEYKQKVRLINMLDTWQILAELMFAKAVQRYMAKQDWYAGGKNDEYMLRKINYYRDKHNYSVTTDYSSYDQTISDWLIHMAFDVMEAGFKFSNPMHKQLFRIVRQDFIHKCILDADLHLHQIDKGVPSGSMFTQIVDSIVNKIMIDSYMMWKDVHYYKCIIMGDDNIIFTIDKIDEDEMAGFLIKVFGVEVNADKMDAADLRAGEDPEFLSRVWTPFGVYRDPKELLARICYPERRRNYKNKLMKPEYIISGYIETFPLGMTDIIDVARFKAQYQLKTLENLSKQELATLLPQLPGSVRVQYMYRAA